MSIDEPDRGDASIRPPFDFRATTLKATVPEKSLGAVHTKLVLVCVSL